MHYGQLENSECSKYPKERHAKQTETMKDHTVEFGLTCVKSFSLYFASKTGSTGMSAGKPSTLTGV